jgi:two-component system, cell cycle sensor histidine kinase and response regulator CckA
MRSSTRAWRFGSRLLLGLAIASFLAPAVRSESSDRIVRASSEVDFEPLASVNPDGEADGFSVELFRAVAKVMKLDTTIRVGLFADIKDDLARDEADVLLNLAESPERARSVDFGVPHTRTKGAIFVRKQGASIRNAADLPNARIAVIRGDLAHDWAISQGWSDRITARDTAEAVMRELASGTVDCALMSRLVGTVTLRKHGLDAEIEDTGEPVDEVEQRFAFAVRKGDSALLAQLNEGLAIVTADGTYDRLYRNWFGPFEPVGVSLRDVMRVALPLGIGALALLVWLNLRLRRSTHALRALGGDLERRIDERTQELRNSVSLLEATLDSTENGILVVDREGRITTFNERFAELWRIPAAVLETEDDDEAIRFAIDQLVDPDAFVAKIREVYATPESESFDVLHFKDGRVFERYSQPQRVDGRPVGRVWSFRDVTEQRNAEQRFRELAESIPEIFWVYDVRDARIQYVNSAFEQIWGMPATTVVASQESFLRCIHPDDHEAKLAAVARQLAGEETSLEYRILRPDGGMRWLWERSFPVRSASGEFVRLHGTAIDITERKKVDAERMAFERNLQEAQKRESLGLLAGGVAHDFNNLLTGVLGQATLARTNLAPDSPLATPLAEIEEAALRAAELCRQMLAYAGKSALARQRLDPNTVVESTLQLLRVSVGKRVQLRWQPDKAVPPVIGDATQLRQVLVNLVRNASEAIGSGSGTITVATQLVDIDRARVGEAHFGAEPADRTCAVISVRDDGPGMDAETRARVFDPFFTTKFAGRGLGLAAVLGIVRAHGGTVEVESALGAGSCFRVLLPADEGPIDASGAQVAAPERTRGSGAVLVVDDEDVVRRVVVRALESAGYEVVAARGGREAIAAVEAAPDRFALVVLDLTMPELDGRETNDRLKRLCPSLPVLLMSGYAEQDASDRFADSDLAGFLPKPFSVQALQQAVASILATGERSP